ncbi:10544_t:CDS:2, partial [Gigaspora margarita]
LEIIEIDKLNKQKITDAFTTSTDLNFDKCDFDYSDHEEKKTFPNR